MPFERPGPWTIERVYRTFPRLAERRQNRGRQFSGGEQEMLSVARALLLNPKLLILDEPSQGLAPLIVAEVFRIVVRHAGGRHVRAAGRAERAGEPGGRRRSVCAGPRVMAWSGQAAELAADEERIQSLAGASAEEWRFDDALTTEETEALRRQAEMA